MGSERDWWLRVPGVLVRPRDVFVAIRVADEEDVQARQEPILLILLLAGMAGVALSPAWGRLLDQGGVDDLVVAVLTFVGGGIYGAAGYFLIGGALYLGARGVGTLAPWRLARHVVAFAAVPLALSFPLLLPIGLAAFGGDLFRAGGADEGAGGSVFLAGRLAFAGWSLLLLLVGARTTYGWSWPRAAGALALLAAFLVALAIALTIL